jgi:glutamate dehydrogenase
VTDDGSTAAADPVPAALGAALDAALDPARAANARALAAATYRRLSPQELARLDVAEAQRLVLGMLEAFERGSTDAPSIRVEDVGASSVVHIHLVDGPFVVSTITEELHRLGLEPIDLAHPVVGVERDADGRLVAITPARSAARRETYLALDLQTQLRGRSRDLVERHLRDVLGDALHVVADFAALKAAVAAMAEEVLRTGPSRHDPAEVEEVAELLRWLLDDHFVFLGYRGYRVQGDAVVVERGSGLGILRDDAASRFATPVPLADLDRGTVAAVLDGPLLAVARTRRTSTVHRQVRMISVTVQRLGDGGQVEGVHRLLGLLAQKAFVEPSSTIPVLRRKLRAVLDAEDVVDHSADERALRTLFDAFPKQELFESDVEELRASLVGLLDSGRRDDVRVMLRRERSGASVSALVTVPRDRFSAELRADVQQLLRERIGADSVDYQLSMTERDQPLLHFTLRLANPERPVEVDVDALQQEIARLTRTFTDALAEALAGTRGAAEARQAAEQWCAILPAAYSEGTAIATAVTDLTELEQLDSPDAVRMRLVREPASGPRGAGVAERLRFRLYKAGRGVELSGFLPLLESLGLTVVEEQPYALHGAPVWEEVHLHDYGVRSELAEVDVRRDGPRIAEAAMAMWRGRAGVDSLNRLIVVAGLTAEEVTVLRAIRRYLRQIGTTYTEATTNDALLEHPGVARALLDLFDARFDPARDEAGRPAAVEAARAEVHARLEAVQRLDQDRILRGFLGVVEATLRTNRWRQRPWLSLKLDSAAVPGVPKPVPYREIFVFSTAMEGVHLRGGPVARGGLRWSDRLDDFRTEVLGLMKAQVSKNAVIVPTGSKGGFVLKQRPADPAALRAEVEAQYRVFIRGLLDLTDTYRGDAVVPPDDVVRADGDDPYLVVAADRGTATFSDIANGISREYGFWLDDAFASGGSSGYDHKAMGITARGAWVAVQRHFRELGIDVQTEPITAVGVGDMSGDVFGNGLLRSRTVRLVAAFDHRDVFVDPDPDPARSFEERRRLFELPRSSWQDYDPALISRGGGVWSRTAKSVPLSPEARAVLHVDAEELSPPELISAILRAPVDLLWFGGIGTYVKAREESHADVGDRANDAVRVDADQVGARVVGEGGNLAMTQRGRIAYGRRGGRGNTDAIDNVGGVDTSDREVNLKILLSLAIESGRLAPEDRDPLLASLTEDVAAQVLRDCYLQTGAISQELAQAPGGMGGYELLMSQLEARGRLDRAVEVLPGTAEVEERRRAGAGFTRPELAVLLAYAKLDATEQLLASRLVDQPAFDEVREDAFPGDVAERFREEAHRHRLRRELVATALANDVVNRMGITWTTRTAVDMGVDVATAATCYWIARQVVDADAVWRSIEALDGRADPLLQLELKVAVDWLVDAYARSYVRLGRAGDVAAAVADDRPAFVQLAAQAGTTTLPHRAEVIRQTAERWIDLGIDEALAEEVAALPSLTLVPGIASTARQSGRSVESCGRVYALVAEQLPLEQLGRRIREVEPSGRWQRAQHRGLLDDLRRLHHGLARQAIAAAPLETAPDDVVATWLGARAEAVTRAQQLARDVQALPAADLDALAVAVRALAEVGG